MMSYLFDNVLQNYFGFAVVQLIVLVLLINDCVLFYVVLNVSLLQLKSTLFAYLKAKTVRVIRISVFVAKETRETEMVTYQL